MLEDAISLSGMHRARSLVHQNEGLAVANRKWIETRGFTHCPLKPRRRLPTSELTRVQPLDWFERSVSVGHRCRVR